MFIIIIYYCYYYYFQFYYYCFIIIIIIIFIAAIHKLLRVEINEHRIIKDSNKEELINDKKQQ